VLNFGKNIYLYFTVIINVLCVFILIPLLLLLLFLLLLPCWTRDYLITRCLTTLDKTKTKLHIYPALSKI
jgi:hypothetical protein